MHADYAHTNVYSVCFFFSFVLTSLLVAVNGMHLKKNSKPRSNHICKWIHRISHWYRHVPNNDSFRLFFNPNKWHRNDATKQETHAQQKKKKKAVENFCPIILAMHSHYSYKNASTSRSVQHNLIVMWSTYISNFRHSNHARTDCGFISTNQMAMA